MNRVEQDIKDIEAQVEGFLNRELSKPNINLGFRLRAADPESREHIIRIGTSVICTKREVGYPGGGFVQAIVNNDLMGAFGQADQINKDCIEFYCKLLYNL